MPRAASNTFVTAPPSLEAAQAYIFDNAWLQARARMQAAESYLDPWTTAQFERIGVTTGWSCLEAGAGTGSVADWLCRRVGTDGHVLALDIDTRFVEAIDHPNLEVRRLDITKEPLEQERFDLVHARLLLSHLPDCVAVLTKLVGSLKPGGWILVEDFDQVTLGLMDASVHPDDARVLQTVLTAGLRRLAERGVDLDLGRHLYGLLRQQGLHQVAADGQVFMDCGGSQFSQFVSLGRRQFRATLSAGGTDQLALDRVLALYRDPEFAVMTHLLTSVRGQRPPN
jgi:SAM-dependent methyltransferase